MLVEAAIVAVLMQKPCPVYRCVGTLAATARLEQSFRPVRQMPDHIQKLCHNQKLLIFV